MKELKGRVAVVTGAASGIGRALALVLAETGCNLALVDNQAEALERVARELADSGVEVSSHCLSVADKPAMLALAEQVISVHGGVQLLINNAGIAVGGTFEEHSLEDFERVMGVNYFGTVYGCHAFLPWLRKNQEAHIVNISSILGIVGVPLHAAYCSSKFAVRGFSEVLWEELAGTGIGVTVVHPAAVSTNLVKTAGLSREEHRQRAVEYFERSTPAQEVARQIVNAVRKNKRRLLVGADAKLGDWLKRLAPQWGNRTVATKLLKDVGIEAWLSTPRKARQPSDAEVV